MHKQQSFKTATNTRQRESEERQREGNVALMSVKQPLFTCFIAVGTLFCSFMLLETQAYTAFSGSRFNVPMAPVKQIITAVLESDELLHSRCNQ